MYVKAVAKFRKRLKKRRMARLEVHVRKDDVIRPSASPGQEQVTRALLREHFGAGQAQGCRLKVSTLAARDFGRKFNL
jgi:hypothetical protein